MGLRHAFANQPTWRHGESYEPQPGRRERDMKPYAVDARWEILSRDVISRCHALGIQVFSDALGQHEQISEYLKAVDWGLDLIQTDHPLRVMRAIELRVSGSSSGAAVSQSAQEAGR